jgi:hypothetical protein
MKSQKKTRFRIPIPNHLFCSSISLFIVIVFIIHIFWVQPCFRASNGEELMLGLMLGAEVPV